MYVDASGECAVAFILGVIVTAVAVISIALLISAIVLTVAEIWYEKTLMDLHTDIKYESTSDPRVVYQYLDQEARLFVQRKYLPWDKAKDIGSEGIKLYFLNIPIIGKIISNSASSELEDSYNRMLEDQGLIDTQFDDIFYVFSPEADYNIHYDYFNTRINYWRDYYGK